MLLRPFQPADEVAVIDLWQRCNLVVPQNDPRRDIARKLAVQQDLFLLAVMDEQIIGTVMVGYEGHRGWINYLAVDPARRLQGIGRALMQAAEERLLALGCPKINLQVRSTNQAVLDFYRALGYRVDDVVSLGKRLIPDA
jgi:ribosomal protein S18 acetylase RimI-like enzyme